MVWSPKSCIFTFTPRATFTLRKTVGGSSKMPKGTAVLGAAAVRSRRLGCLGDVSNKREESLKQPKLGWDDFGKHLHLASCKVVPKTDCGAIWDG